MLFLLVSVAHAWTSEPQIVELADSVSLFDGVSLDSGWVPSGSPLQVRFQVLSAGGAEVWMEGTGSLTWPDSVTLGLDGEPGTGELTLDSTISAITSIRFDVSGYSWSSEIDNRSFTFTGDTTFDPLVLPGGTPDSVTVTGSGSATQVIDYNYEVLPGVRVAFTADLTPQVTVDFAGVSWGVDDQSVTESGGTLVLTPSGEPTQDVSVTYVGEWDSELDLVLTPTLTVCVPVAGCVDLASFDIPLTVASDAFEQAFPPVDLSFPLPQIATDVDAYDFGPVQVGEVATLEVPVYDLGELELEGVAGVSGSDYFDVWPETVLASTTTSDGVVVTFAPESEGTFSATLELATNDPASPTLEIPLSGEGVQPPDTGDAGSAGVVSTEVKGCGCATGGAPTTGGLAMLLVAGLALVRRRDGADG